MRHRFVSQLGRSGLAAIGMLAALAAASPAMGLTIGGAGGPAFEVEPIYFTAFGEFGLTGPGSSGPNYIVTAPVSFLSIAPTPAGDDIDLELSQLLSQPPHQHPQDPANSENPGTNGGVPSTPTTAVPFVADSTWTVRNLTGRPLDDLVLLFTRIIDGAGYPVVDVALDDTVYDVLQYTNDSAVTRYYGAIALGDLAADPLAAEASVTFGVRYIVTGALPIDDGEYLMPRFGLAGIESPPQIPEPGTALLIGLGLVAIARGSRV